MKKNIIWIFIFLFTFSPLIFISFFNLPMGDDFYFGHIGRNNNVVKAVSYWYNGWGGRYTQEFFLTVFNPLSFKSLNFFWMPPIVIIFSIVSVVFILIRSIGKKIQIKEVFILTVVFLFLFFNLMPEIGETLYWISGSYTFQIGNLFFIILVISIFKLNQEKEIYKQFLYLTTACFIIIITVGCNEVIMVYVFGFSILHSIYQFINNKKLFILSLFIFVVALLSSCISIFAPGNLVRASITGGIIQNFPKAIIESSVRAGFYIIFWLPSTIIISLFIWKYISKIASQYSNKKNCSKKEMYTVFAFFFLIICVGFIPSLAATGWNPPRSVAPVFLIFLLCYFGILIYYFDFFDLLFSKLKLTGIMNSTLLLFILIIGLSNKHNIMNAYVDIVALKTFKYNKQVKKLYNDLETTKKDTVYFSTLACKPTVLPIRWPDYNSSLVSSELEMYFNKKVVIATNAKK